MRNSTNPAAHSLAEFLRRHPRLTILSGAGCSTASGIPDYRDDNGDWKHARPVQFADFVASEITRRRYWARSFAGWTRVSVARPNDAHHALAALEKKGHVTCLITQNVDNLHRVAGSMAVVDLHGVLHKVKCLECASVTSRQTLQEKLRALNPHWSVSVSGYTPDGDAQLDRDDYASFNIAPCATCGGMLKPDVVFFGEAVPSARVRSATEKLTQSDALLVVGSSLMVWSGFRFARQASEAGIPIAILNRGRTRADELATFRENAECGTALRSAARELGALQE